MLQHFILLSGYFNSLREHRPPRFQLIVMVELETLELLSDSSLVRAESRPTHLTLEAKFLSCLS